MKKFIAIFVLCFAALSFGAFAQIKVASTGKVGVNNTSPAYWLDVSGDFRVSDSGGDLIKSLGALYPVSSWCLLGTSNYKWDEIYAVNEYFMYAPTILSDQNKKTDIRNIPESIGKIQLLRPVSYKLKPEFKGDAEADAKIAERAKQNQLGFLAQEVREIFPEIISEQEDGTLGIRYTELIPVLVKALQEQQQVIDDLKSRVEMLETAKK